MAKNNMPEVCLPGHVRGDKGNFQGVGRREFENLWSRGPVLTSFDFGSNVRRLFRVHKIIEP